MLLAGLSDVVIICLALVAAIWGNSLMMAAETLRGALLVALEMVLLVLLRRIHRGRTQQFDYGAGKLEQFANLGIGTAMGLAGAWVAVSAAYRWWNPPAHASGGLIFAVAIGALNLVQNGLALWGLWRAGQDGTSLIINGQIRTRLTKLASSGIVFVALCVNATLGSGVWGRIAEVAGSAFVAIVMLELAVSMWRQALPSLLDRTLDEGRQSAINQVLAAHFEGYDDLIAVRSRLSGKTAFVEVVLGFDPKLTIGEVQSWADRMTADIGELIPEASVAIIPTASGRFPR